jgi:hypothetical protein
MSVAWLAVIVPAAAIALWFFGALFGQWWNERALESDFAKFADTFDEVCAACKAELDKQTSVDADWVALRENGFAFDHRIKSLSKRDQVRHKYARQKWRERGERLVAKGWLCYFSVTFENQGAEQQINPPNTLFMLTDTGLAKALERQINKEESK